MSTILIALLLLQVKHFICDFLYQPPYMWMNKGTFGHPGGILHAGFHGVATVALLSMVVPFGFVLIGVSLFETIVHYLIDWAKMNINSHYGLKCNTSEQFWQLLGVDQLLHQITYVGIVFLLF